MINHLNRTKVSVVLSTSVGGTLDRRTIALTGDVESDENVKLIRRELQALIDSTILRVGDVFSVEEG